MALLHGGTLLPLNMKINEKVQKETKHVINTNAQFVILIITISLTPLRFAY